ncbi:MAG: sialate O-acetylesterase [Chitinophagaceae bacterium]
MNRKIFVTNFLILLVLFFGTNCLANIKLPAIFSDGMVLQQQSTANIWGWASPNEKVTISTSWNNKTVVINANGAGEWKAVFATPKASMNSHTLVITGNNSITLKDVLIGEVWVASGQSNMGFSLKSDVSAKTEIPQANFPNIRYFYVERQYGLQKFNDAPGSVWKKTTPETAPNFSAVAYYFAKKIQQEKNVPVGIVYAAWGGTPAEAWTPGEVLTSDTVLTKYIDRWKFIQENAGKDSVAYQKELNNWEISKQGKKPEEPQTFYYFKRPWREPSVLFNGMIDPVIPYSVKGVLWYQGESNVGYAKEYYQLFTKMINAWRDRWNQPKMPFYFVQISAFGYADMNAAAVVREAQYLTSKNIPNTAMAVTTDLGNMGDIHFTKKAPVGYRLALIALNKNYDEKVNFKGPEFKCVKWKKNQLILKFKTANALQTDGKPLDGFEIGYQLPGTDSIAYQKVSAEISGNNVLLKTNGSAKPVAVRYAWMLVGEANLADKDGLPAFPFTKKIK